ncbi:hypothetical protein B0H14DRAFT_3154934 [Mycena olivaceomarginata]|nr:hypothetical protein B0H14DRAFT_3154934 [Mycena olivaceomarginata]
MNPRLSVTERSGPRCNFLFPLGLLFDSRLLSLKLMPFLAVGDKPDGCISFASLSILAGFGELFNSGRIRRLHPGLGVGHRRARLASGRSMPCRDMPNAYIGKYVSMVPFLANGVRGPGWERPRAPADAPPEEQISTQISMQTDVKFDAALFRNQLRLAVGDVRGESEPYRAGEGLGEVHRSLSWEARLKSLDRCLKTSLSYLTDRFVGTLESTGIRIVEWKSAEKPSEKSAKVFRHLEARIYQPMNVEIGLRGNLRVW